MLAGTECFEFGRKIDTLGKTGTATYRNKLMAGLKSVRGAGQSWTIRPKPGVAEAPANQRLVGEGKFIQAILARTGNGPTESKLTACRTRNQWSGNQVHTRIEQDLDRAVP